MNNFKSEQINELASALAKAQNEMLVAGTGSDNPFFKSKYADYATIVRASRPALCKHGLSITQILNEGDDGVHRLITMLMHASGQNLSSTVKIAPLKQDPQSLGSYTTYMKRYAYMAIVGMTSTSDDDDGEAAMVGYRDAKHTPQSAYDQRNKLKENVHEKISLDQLSQLEHILRDRPDIAELVLRGLGIETLDQMPKVKYITAVDRINTLRQTPAQ